MAPRAEGPRVRRRQTPSSIEQIMHAIERIGRAYPGFCAAWSHRAAPRRSTFCGSAAPTALLSGLTRWAMPIGRCCRPLV